MDLKLGPDDDWVAAAKEIIAWVDGEWIDFKQDERSLRMVAHHPPPPGLGRISFCLATDQAEPHPNRVYTSDIYSHEALVELLAAPMEYGGESLHVVFRVTVVNAEDLKPMLGWCRDNLGLPPLPRRSGAAARA